MKADIKRSLSWLFLLLSVVVSVVIIVGYGRSAKEYQISSAIINIRLEEDSKTIMFKSLENVEFDKEVERILAWIKTERPEWNTGRGNLTFYLATQPFIDKWLKNQYDVRKKKGLPVPEYFNEPGRSAAFFVKVAEKNYIYLPWNFTLLDTIDEDTLVHELVHYVLRLNGYEDRCLGDAEFVAHFFVVLYLIEEKGMTAGSKQVVWNMKEAGEYICDSD